MSNIGEEIQLGVVQFFGIAIYQAGPEAVAGADIVELDASVYDLALQAVFRV